MFISYEQIVSIFETIYVHFTDPILRAPVIGCMLMSLASSLIGVIVVLRKESLLGEALSHAAYPGVIFGVIFAGLLALDETEELKLSLIIIFGAFSSALVGLWVIQWMQHHLKVRADSALCFVLSSFFGLGITLSSEVQFSFTTLYRQVQVYLFGQAATMMDIHIIVYALFSSVVVGTLVSFYKEIKLIIFDRDYAKCLGIKVKLFDILIFILIALAVVIGIRSVGVVLMSSMLITPAVSARQFTNRLSRMFFLAALFGILSGFLGVFFSNEISQHFAAAYGLPRFALPTGPTIVLVISFICVLSLLFAPERGLFFRLIRIGRFRYQCLYENLLKSLWFDRFEKEIALRKQKALLHVPSYYLSFILWRFMRNGWVERKSRGSYVLTKQGMDKAAHIVRLHRLWEVYLADYLGVGAERVHRSAEEMEHILTPEIEQELTVLLNDPKRDPHQRSIPPKTERL